MNRARTIVGTGNVLVARKPFRVFSWLDRGHYRVGDTIKAYFNAHTLDQKPVEGKGELHALQDHLRRQERAGRKGRRKWSSTPTSKARPSSSSRRRRPGKYRLSYRLTDKKDHTIEGGYVFVVRGDGFDGRDFRFNDLELVTDQREYAPGDKVKLHDQHQHGRRHGAALRPSRPTASTCRRRRCA